MTWLDSVWPPCLIMGVCVAASLWELIRGWDVPNSSKEQRRKLQGLWKPNLESYTAWFPLHSTGQNESQGQLRFQGHQLPMVKGVRLGEKLVDLLLIISYSLPPGYKIPRFSCVQNALRVSQDPQSLMQSWTETPSPKSHHLKRPRCTLSFLGVIPRLKLLRCNSYGSRGWWTK